MNRSTFLDSSGPNLLAKLDEGRTVFGVFALSPSPEFIEVLAYVGFDFVIVDQMFTGVDWRELQHIVRAVRGSGMAVIARVENDPWNGGDDLGVAARVGRAMGVGCDGVRVSVYSAAQARAVLRGATGWHRNIHVNPMIEGDDDRVTRSGFTDLEASRVASALVIPSVESQLGIEETPEIIAIEGLRLFGIAMSDTTRTLGRPMEYDHPDVWRYVDSTVSQAREHGVDICSGTGYTYQTPDEIAGRVQQMVSHGIKMIFLQSPEFLFQLSMADLLGKVRRALPA
jgi:4-hydroxy-2-oxoheptanedioate aldolase